MHQLLLSLSNTLTLRCIQLASHSAWVSSLSPSSTACHSGADDMKRTMTEHWNWNYDSFFIDLYFSKTIAVRTKKKHSMSGDRGWGRVLRRGKCQGYVWVVFLLCWVRAREAKCEDLSSPAASITLASSDCCRKLGGGLTSCLSDKHAIYAAGR